MPENDYIQVTTRLRRKRILKMAYNVSPQDGKKIPAVRFSGSYLEDLGFNLHGHYMMIINADNTITLRGLTPEQKVELETSDN